MLGGLPYKSLKKLTINRMPCNIESMLVRGYKSKGSEHDGAKTY